jgi:hypothetical protein
VAKFAAHLLELLALFWGQNIEGFCLGLPGDNPQLGLDFVLNCCMSAKVVRVEVGRILVGRTIGLATVTKLLGEALDFRPCLVDDGLDLGELLVAQAELLGQARQHALEEAKPVYALRVADPTLITTVAPLAASPGTAGSGAVSGAGPVLSEDRCWCRQESGCCDGQNEISCSHIYLRVLPLVRLVQS